MYYFDRERRRISRDRWEELRDDPTYRLVKRTELWWGVSVLTTWHGVDRAQDSKGYHIFTTVVTYRHTQGDENVLYSRTENEAIATHDSLLFYIRVQTSVAARLKAWITSAIGAI